MAKVILLSGGASSGKSTYALRRASTYNHKAFIATAEACDDEMRARITRHQMERGDEYRTFEEPIHLGCVLSEASQPGGVVIVDCLTVWLGNLLHYFGSDMMTAPPFQKFLDALSVASSDVIVVTNEVGCGIIPADAATRSYRETAGRLNQLVAGIAEEVVFMVCGIPWRVK